MLDEALISLGRGGMSALTGLAHVLDAPGSFVRGMLSGEPGRAFSGLINPEDRVYGWEMLDRMGMPKNKEGLDWMDVPAFALEVATDPLSYLTAPLSAGGKIAKQIGALPRRTFEHSTGKLIKGTQMTRRGTSLREVMENAPRATQEAGRLRVGQMAEKMARKAGVDDITDDVLRKFGDDIMDEPLSAGMHWAGMQANWMKAPGDFALSAIDRTANIFARGKLFGVGPRVGVYARRLFSKEAQNLWDMGGQEIASQSFRAREEFEATAKILNESWGNKLAKELSQPGADPEIAGRVLANQGRLMKRYIEDAATPEQIGKMFDETLEIGDLLKESYKLYKADFAKVGRGLDWDSIFGTFAHRQWTHAGKRGKAAKGVGFARIADIAADFFHMRDEAFDIPGATEGVNDLFEDVLRPKGAPNRWFGSNRVDPEEALQTIMNDYLHISPEQVEQAARLAEKAAKGVLSTEEELAYKAISHQMGQATKLRDRLYSYPKTQTVKTAAGKVKKPFEPFRPFSNHPLVDHLAYEMQAGRVLDNLKTIQRMFGQFATVRAAGELAEEGAAPGGVSIGKALAGSKLNSREGLEYFLNETIKRQAVGEADALAIAEAKRILPLVKNAPDAMPLDDVFDMAKNLTVPEGMVRDANRLKALFDPNVKLNPVIQGWDKFMNSFRGLVTAPFPAFHMRNMATEFWQHMVATMDSPGEMSAALRSIKQAHGVLAGEAMGDLGIADLKNFDDFLSELKAADVQFASELHAFVGGRANEAVRRGVKSLEPQELPPMAQPIANPKTFGQVMLDPFNPMHWVRQGREASEVAREHGIRGFTPTAGGGITGGIKNGVQRMLQGLRLLADPTLVARAREGLDVDVNLASRIGRDVGAYVDNLFRVATYIRFRQKGYVPMEAARMSKSAHVDYAMISQFERQTMKRATSFYTWTRRMLPWQMGLIAARPGGFVPQVIRAGQKVKGEGFVPGFIGRGLAIPLGEESKEGEQRFLSRLDLPFEAVLEPFNIAENPLSMKSAEEMSKSLLGQLAPPLKAPFELGFGEQLYSGRNLGDLRSRLGQMAVTAGLAERPDFMNQLLEYGLMASPASRAISTLGTLMDPRKLEKPLAGVPGGAAALNLLTGAHVTDVDIARSRLREAQDYIEELSKGSPYIGKMEKLFVSKENVEKLSPEERWIMRLYKGLNKDIQQKNAARRMMRLNDQ